uniref:cytochrome c oxidase subunit II n=1 Tax=Haemadipsa yanyuanensis TaxID=2870508 RepID=UPI0023D88BCC|nr:cytochrome c oxidase subunit II [Haemadipsa yanyuanensis]WDA96158.1 cytochrome c oxidase subunit II [Haemadipsa yanyuanensis]
MPFWNQMMMQDSMSTMMINISSFHDYMIITMVLVLSIISYVMLNLCMTDSTNRNILEAQELETLWTIAPAIVLIMLAIPSIKILYMLDEISDPLVTIKTMGHQWYWSYQYSDLNNIEFDSYMLPTEELMLGDYRLLEVDNRLFIPFNKDIRMIISSSDVIHSWTIPSLGIKVDAIPGRLNQMAMNVLFPSVLYGQCSEICGANHSFMPICIEAINTKDFIKKMV